MLALAGMLLPAVALGQTGEGGGGTASGGGGGAAAGAAPAGGTSTLTGGAPTLTGPGGFLRSPGFDAYGQPLPPGAPSFSALEAFGFPPSPAGPIGQTRPYDWSASIGGQVLGTDNVNLTPTNRQADVGFTLLPAISASADTANLRGYLSYAPSLTYYANTPGQNRFNNFLTASGRVTMLEDKLFLQLNGFATVTAASGGFAPVGTPQVGIGNQVQTYAFQAAPYYVQRFGDLGTVNIGYAYRWYDQTGSNAYAPGSSTPFFTSQTTQGNQGWAVLRSGERFGRLLFSVRLIGTLFTGTGVYNDAHQATASFQTSYAINRWLAVLGEIGYENAQYSGTTPYIIKEMTWGIGARVTPDPNSAIIAAVRKRDGFVAPFADVAVQLSPRIRLNGYYRETLTTSGVQSLDLLNSITYDALGNPVDRFAGAPLVIPFATTPIGALGGPLDGGIANPGGAAYGGSFLSNQIALMRMRSGSGSISQLWERDALSLSIFYQESTPVAVVKGTTAFQQSGTSFGVTWSHLLSEVTSLSTYLSFGRYNTANLGNSNTWTGRVLLSHQFSPSIYGSLQYVYTNRGLTIGSDNATQNIILATLRKTF